MTGPDAARYASSERLLAPTSRAAIGGVLAALVNAAMRVTILPLLVAPLFDRVLLAGDASALPSVLATSGIVVLVGSLALWAQDGLLAAAAAETARAWRSRLYRELLLRRPGTLPGSSGGLSNRILADLREIETYYQFGLGSVVAESATIVGIVGYLFWTDAVATLLLVALGLPTFIALRAAGRVIEYHADRTQRGIESLGRHLQEGFRHHAIVRAFRADRLLRERMEASNRTTARALRARGVVAGLQTPLAQVLVFAAVAGLMLLLVRRVQAGALSAGEMVTFLSLIALLATPLQLLPRGVALLQQARVAARRLRALQTGPDASTGSGDPAAHAAPPDSATGASPLGPRLELRKVCAGYRDADTEVTVLEGVDLAFPPQGLIAVTGESGAGKSTLLQTLLGFLPPLRGEVRLDGRALDTWREAELRARIAYVPQELDLLSGSLRENLTLGRAFASTDLMAAVDAAGLRATIDGLGDGLETELGEDGAGLSGGQRQRIAVARALLGDPRIVLLDEPTSALDGPTERALIDLLTVQARHRLVIAVAHRPALADAADAVLHVERGTLRWRRAPNAAHHRGTERST